MYSKAPSSPISSSLSEERIGAYSRDGYLIVRNLFAADEIEFLKRTAEGELPNADVLTKRDRQGNKISLKMWNQAGEDVYGLFSRNERIVQPTQELVGGEVYLYS